jgi:hypothetical protein
VVLTSSPEPADPVLVLVLIALGLLAPLVGGFGLAVRRSTRQEDSVRLRDQLMDAVRRGRLDPTDWRLVGLIDWLDQVASTGRTDTLGRHSGGHGDPADSLALGLAATLLPLGPDPDTVTPDPVADLQAEAFAFREKHQTRPAHRRRRPTRPDSPVIVAGGDVSSAPARPPLPSLVEEIFAVADPGH